jgi:hypothetical protein
METDQSINSAGLQEKSTSLKRSPCDIEEIPPNLGPDKNSKRNEHRSKKTRTFTQETQLFVVYTICTLFDYVYVYIQYNNHPNK